MLKDYLKENQPLFYRIISREFNQNKIPHAFLLHGKHVDECMNFIKMSLICDNVLACETCIDCQKVLKKQYSDILEFNGDEESIKKKHIEQIQNTFYKSSLEGKSKIYVIQSIEKSTAEAMNALLKMLEEPTEGIYAIFTTKNINKVLPTIISRCQVLEIKDHNNDMIKSFINDFHLSEEDASVLSHLFDNSEAIEQLDMDNYYDIKKEVFHFIDDLFLHRENLIINTQIHLVKNHNNKKDMSMFLNMLVLALKDMFHVKHNQKIIYTDNIQKLKTYTFDYNDLIKKIELVLETLNYIDYNANIPLLMDSMMYRI